MWVILKDKRQWPAPKSKDQLIEDMSALLSKNVPGAVFGYTQPIQMRVDELVAGVKAQVAVLLFGEDLKILADKAGEIERTLKSIPGARDVKADYQANLTTITIVPSREALRVMVSKPRR